MDGFNNSSFSDMSQVGLDYDKFGGAAQWQDWYYVIMCHYPNET